MKPAPIPKNETERLAALQRLNLLDTEPEERFDRLVRLAKIMFEVPVAAITLVDTDRQWFKACIGLGITETSRDIAFSSHAINSDSPFVVPDTHLDERFANNPLVVKDLHVRFYAGKPIKSIDNHNIGTLCLIDFVPRTLSNAELVSLNDLAEVIERETNYQEVDFLRQRLIQSNQQLEQEALERIETEKALRESQAQLTEAQQIGRLGAWSWDTIKDEVKWNDTLYEIFDVPLGSPVDAARYTETIHPDDRAASWHIIQSAMEMGETSYTVGHRIVRRNGEIRYIFGTGNIMRDEHGQPIKLVGIARDVTEQKQYELELEATQQEARHLANEAKAQAFRLTLLNEMSKALSLAEDDQAMYLIAAHRIPNIVLADRASVSLLLPNGTHYQILELQSEAGAVPVAENLPMKNTSFAEVINSKKPLNTPNLHENNSGLKHPMTDLGLNSSLSVPIMLAERVIGTLNVASKTFDAYGPLDEDLLLQAASILGANLQNFRLYSQTQEARANVETINQTLAEERNMLRTLIDNLPDFIYAKDKESRFLLANLAVAQVMGASHPDDLLGKTDFDFYPEEMAQKFYGDERRLLKFGQPLLNLEEKVVNPQGDKIWILTSKMLLTNHQGEVTGFVGLGRDITERKKYEHFLQEARTEARNLAATAKMHADRMTLLNEMSQHMNLATTEADIFEIIGQHLNKIIPSDRVSVGLLNETRDYINITTLRDESELLPDRDIIPLKGSLLGQALETKTVVNISDGFTDGPISASTLTQAGIQSLLIAPILIGEHPIGVLNVLDQQPGKYDELDEDILLHTAAFLGTSLENIRLLTEAKIARESVETANEALRIQEAEARKLSMVASATDNPVVITNHKQEIEWVNEAFTHLTEYTLSEAQGQIPSVLLQGPNTDQEVARTMQEKYRQGQGFKCELINYSKSGREYWVEVEVQPVYGEADQLTNFIAITRDITARREHQQQLEKAKQEAIAATRAKSEFLANMSHELRTPMNGVIGMTSLLLDTSLNNEQLEFVRTIRTSGDSLLTIINDILDFSKIEAGKLELEEHPFNLRRCIEDALDLIAPKAAEKKLEVAYLIENQLPATFIGDVTRVRQILVNLLSNAVKFTETGEIVISVNGTILEHVSKVDDYPTYTLQFSVRDTGIGIPKRRLGRLFRSFSQVDASTSRRYGGTGLGLAISKQLSEMMGGTMWVESEVNRGSTFYFTVQGQATASQEPVTWSGEQPDLANKRVLVVDDNSTNQRILEKYTLSWGMRPTLATSGPEALKLLQRDPPFDVAILDVQMPFMDGITLANEIRNHYHSTSLPIIMLTSLGRQELNSEGIKFTTYLNKPLKPSLLYNALIEIMVGIAPTQPQKFMAPNQFEHSLGRQHPLRILLAEDNLVNQKVALGILNRIGYRADVAANGLEVLEALQRQSYDVVLMDIQMPDMDGVTATQKIRERFSPKERPHIIAMTAHALQGDREKYLAAGMDDYLTKPVRIKELIETLNRYQSKSGRADSVNGNRPAQEPPEAAGTLDHTVLQEFGTLMGEDGPEIITELIDLFLQDSPGLLAELRHGVETSDPELVRYTAHTLKSSSASLGAMGLSDLCETLETMGRTANLDLAAEKVVQAEAHFDRVKLELKELWQQFEQKIA